MTAVILKAGTTAPMLENRGAADVALTAEDLAEIDKVFSLSRRTTPLAMI